MRARPECWMLECTFGADVPMVMKLHARVARPGCAVASTATRAPPVRGERPWGFRLPHNPGSRPATVAGLTREDRHGQPNDPGHRRVPGGRAPRRMAAPDRVPRHRHER